MSQYPEGAVSFRVQERRVIEGIEFPWDPIPMHPIAWRTLRAAEQAMENIRLSGNDESIQYRIVKVITLVVVKDDEDLDYSRASGDCICEQCGKKFYDHPMAEEIIGYLDQPWLHRLCDGSLVKL